MDAPRPPCEAVRDADPGARGIEPVERPAATVGTPCPGGAGPSRPRARRSSVPSPASPDELEDRDLLIPVEACAASQLTRQFYDERGGIAAARSDRHPRPAQYPGAWPSRTARSPGCSSARPAASPSTSSTRPADFCYYYAHLERYADGLREGETVRKGQTPRLRRHFGQCPQKHAPPALCHLPADRAKALVGRHSHRPLRRPPLSFVWATAWASNLSGSPTRPSLCRRGAWEPVEDDGHAGGGAAARGRGTPSLQERISAAV